MILHVHLQYVSNNLQSVERIILKALGDDATIYHHFQSECQKSGQNTGLVLFSLRIVVVLPHFWRKLFGPGNLNIYHKYQKSLCQSKH